MKWSFKAVKRKTYFFFVSQPLQSHRKLRYKLGAAWPNKPWYHSTQGREIAFCPCAFVTCTATPYTPAVYVIIFSFKIFRNYFNVNVSDTYTNNCFLTYKSKSNLEVSSYNNLKPTWVIGSCGHYFSSSSYAASETATEFHLAVLIRDFCLSFLAQNSGN